MNRPDCTNEEREIFQKLLKDSQNIAEQYNNDPNFMNMK